MKLRFVPFLAVALILTVLFCPVVSVAQIVPHRALYKMSLDSVRTGSSISHVEGTMVFDWADACDGWAIQQRMNLRFTHNEGKDADIDSTVVMWEAKDGARYNFNVRRLINGKEDESYKGRARLGKDEGVIVYALPKERGESKIPLKTLFPSGHTKMIIKKAKAGEKFFTRRVFDGSDEEGSADVSAFIGAAIKENHLGKELRSNPLLQVAAWPVRLAFFLPDSQEGLPEYEMDLVLQENGIARSMVIDYGDFSVKGELVKLDGATSLLCPQL